MKDTSINELRKAARCRRRRIIVNDDGGDIDATPEKLLNHVLRHLLGTQVDSIFYNTGSGLSHHNTKVGELAGEYWYSTPSEHARLWANSAKALIEQGRDCLQIVVDFAHENGLEAFWSLRMNDTHDAKWRSGIPRFKSDHPEWLIGEVGKGIEGKDDDRTVDLWRSTALNYAVDEVREYRFRLIEEVCENYDVDGVEMDFGRMPFYFKPGEVEKNMGLITDFIRRVRERIDEVEMGRDRPVLLATRVPGTVELCHRIGLDIETYLKEDLIDLLIAGFGYTPFAMPVEELINLGHRYDVPVYPCICNDPRLADVRVDADATTRTEQFRAAATNFWNAGADGIYIFNVNMVGAYGSSYYRFNQIGDLGTLAHKDKLYLVTIAVEPHISMDYACLSPPLPLVLPPVTTCNFTGVMRTLNINVGDDVEKFSSQGLISEMSLRLRFKGLSDGELSVKLNGEVLTDGEIIRDKVSGSCWLEYDLTAPPLKKGVNSIEITRKYLESAVEMLILKFVELWVRFI